MLYDPDQNPTMGLGTDKRPKTNKWVGLDFLPSQLFSENVEKAGPRDGHIRFLN